MILILLLPLILFQACGPLPDRQECFVEKTCYDSPLKPCAYEYPDLRGNLCVVEINDKTLVPKLPQMDHNETLVIFSKMVAAKQCERSGGKILAEEIIDNNVFEMCFIPKGLNKETDCYKSMISYFFEDRIVCLSYLSPANENPSNEMMKSKLLAMKDRLEGSVAQYKANAGKMSSVIPGRAFKDVEGNYFVIESHDEHYYLRPPTCTREEYAAYLLNTLADIQCKKPGSKKVHSEMTDEGYFVALELPKGINNSENCTKGVLSYYKGDYIYHLCCLVPEEKKANIEMLKEKLTQLKRTL